MKKNNSFNKSDLFDDFLAQAYSISSVDSKPISIVEFAEEIVFNGEAQLYPPQRAILKAFYEEDLSDDEKLILYDWKDNQEITRTTWTEGRQYVNMVLESGRGSGKSTMIAILALYEFYNLINLPDPAKHYGKITGSSIDIMCIAQSFDQVKETLFKNIKGYAENSSYFNSLIKSKTIEVLSDQIRCEDKNIALYAKHTRTENLVGYNIKCLILDEVARFDIDEFGKSKGDEVWDNLGRSVVTRFGRHGKKIAISSAWEPGDYIEKLYKLAEQSPNTLGFRLKTWQVNLDPNSSEQVIKSSDDYIKDPVTAALEYEGIRTLKQGTFFLPEQVKAAFKGYSACDSIQIPLDIINEENETRNYTGIQITRLAPLLNKVSFAHCDYGVKKDGAALAVCSPIEVESGKWGISVDILLMWKPYIDKDNHNRAIKRIVSFLNCEEVFLQIAKARRVQKFSFDSFQSQNTIQRLHYEGISTCEMSTSNEMQAKYFNTTRILMNEGLLLLPKDSAWSSTAELDLSNIIQMPNGKITHPANFGKDLPDAITNSVYNCYLYMIQTGMLNLSSTIITGISTVKSNIISSNNNIVTIRNQGLQAVRKVKSLKPTTFLGN